MPLLLSLYSSSIFLTGCVTIVGRRYGTYQVHGTPAYWLAGAVIGFALLLHCRKFWSNTRRMAPWGELGVLLFLIATVACLLGFVATGFSLFSLLARRPHQPDVRSKQAMVRRSRSRLSLRFDHCRTRSQSSPVP